MRHSLLIVLLFGFFQIHCIGQNSQARPLEQKVTCNELLLSFIIPKGFRKIETAAFGKLEEKGNKAIKEEYGDREKIKGWQKACINLQDSLKRTILSSAITEKEAVEINGSADEFIQATITDYNDFMIKRIETKLQEKLVLADVAEQRNITVGGYKVRVNDFTWKMGETVMLMSRTYFYRHEGKIIMIAFTGGVLATDNNLVQQALENGKRIQN